jgi:hypothetical protein
MKMTQSFYDVITVTICYTLFWSTIIALILYYRVKQKKINQRINKLKKISKEK